MTDPRSASWVKSSSPHVTGPTSTVTSPRPGRLPGIPGSPVTPPSHARRPAPATNAAASARIGREAGPRRAPRLNPSVLIAFDADAASAGLATNAAAHAEAASLPTGRAFTRSRPSLRNTGTTKTATRSPICDPAKRAAPANAALTRPQYPTETPASPTKPELSSFACFVAAPRNCGPLQPHEPPGINQYAARPPAAHRNPSTRTMSRAFPRLALHPTSPVLSAGSRPSRSVSPARARNLRLSTRSLCSPHPTVFILPLTSRPARPSSTSPPARSPATPGSPPEHDTKASPRTTPPPPRTPPPPPPAAPVPPPR